MKTSVAVYYCLLGIILVGQFISILSTRTIGVQQATARSIQQQEINRLEIEKHQLEKKVYESLSLQNAPSLDGYQTITDPIALTQSDLLLAIR